MNSKLKRGLSAGLMGAALLGLPFFVPFPVQAEAGVDKQAVEKAPWQILPPYDRPFLDVPEGSDTIMGPATVPPEQMVRFIRQRNADPKLNAPLEDVVQAYYDEAGREGIRPSFRIIPSFTEKYRPGLVSTAAGPSPASTTARKSSGCGPKPRRRTGAMTTC